MWEWLVNWPYLSPPIDYWHYLATTLTSPDKGEPFFLSITWNSSFTNLIHSSFVFYIRSCLKWRLVSVSAIITLIEKGESLFILKEMLLISISLIVDVVPLLIIVLQKCVCERMKVCTLSFVGSVVVCVWTFIVHLIQKLVECVWVYCIFSIYARVLTPAVSVHAHIIYV